MKKEIYIDGLGSGTYEETFWTGKKIITINGVQFAKQSKTSYSAIINDELVFLNVYGNFFNGVNLVYGEQTVSVVPKTLWYEYVFAILSICLVVIWGSSVDLCEIIPVVGGAIGGALSAFVAFTALTYSKERKNPLHKVLIGLAGVAVAFLVCAFIGMLIVGALS